MWGSGFRALESVELCFCGSGFRGANFFCNLGSPLLRGGSGADREVAVLLGLEYRIVGPPVLVLFITSPATGTPGLQFKAYSPALSGGLPEGPRAGRPRAMAAVGMAEIEG